MTATYEGGLGTRDGGDLVRWTLEIADDGVSEFRVGARSPMLVQTRDVTATLTLHSVSKDESFAVVTLLNEMRGGGPKEYAKPSPIGNRFSGLEFD